jgi:hypothetical protein
MKENGDVERECYNPNLKHYLDQVFEECYGDAMLRAAVETGLPSTTFPTSSAFKISEVLDINYLPEAEAPDIA